MKTRPPIWLMFVATLVLLLPSPLITYAQPLQQGSCPTSSSNSYGSGPMYQYDNDNPVRPAYNHADKNLALRGYSSVNAAKSLVNYGSDDPIQPPQFATLFNPSRLATFSNVYNVNSWNWQPSPNPGTRGGPATAPWPVTVLGLQTTPGEVLKSPTHARNIGNDFGTGGAMVMFADADSITLKFTREDTAATGYTVHIDNICTDPNLLALYNSLDNTARNTYSSSRPYSYNLPGLTAGQVFGTARDTEIRVAIVDSGSFMDPRSQNEWWQIRPAPPSCFTLTTAANPGAGGTVTTTPTGSCFSSNTAVTLTAVPAHGYYFTAWSGASTSTSKALPLTITGNVSVTANFAAYPCPFTDIAGSFAHDAICEAAARSIMPGTSSSIFSTQGLITRSAMATFMANAYQSAKGSAAPVVSTPFSDIGNLPGSVQNDIARIYGLGITTGTTATAYSPDLTISRNQMGTFLARLYKSIHGSDAPTANVPFTDIWTTGEEWAQPGIQRIYGLGITVGTTATTFTPYALVTREQMALFVVRLLRSTGN